MRDSPAIESPAHSPGIVITEFFTALVPIDSHEDYIRWHLEYIDPSKDKGEGALTNPSNLRLRREIGSEL